MSDLFGIKNIEPKKIIAKPSLKVLLRNKNKLTMMNFILKNKATLLGIGLGAIAGFAYYFYVGCTSGNCQITSKPLNSTIYGGLMGGLLFSTFGRKKEIQK